MLFDPPSADILQPFVVRRNGGHGFLDVVHLENHYTRSNKITDGGLTNLMDSGVRTFLVLMRRA